MAKLIISCDAEVLQTVPLTKERLTIGRHNHNDIVLPHPTVSGEHAVIAALLDDAYLEDQNSTNGTFVNGHRVGKHRLQNRDRITIAKFQIEFVVDGMRAFSAGPATPTLLAHIRILNGTNGGKRLTLTKQQTTLGRAGVQVVLISRHTESYTIEQVDGEQAPLVNGLILGKQAQTLQQGDVIDLAGTQMVFALG